MLKLDRRNGIFAPADAHRPSWAKSAPTAADVSAAVARIADKYVTNSGEPVKPEPKGVRVRLIKQRARASTLGCQGRCGGGPVGEYRTALTAIVDRVAAAYGGDADGVIEALGDIRAIATRALRG